MLIKDVFKKCGQQMLGNHLKYSLYTSFCEQSDCHSFFSFESHCITMIIYL